MISIVIGVAFLQLFKLSMLQFYYLKKKEGKKKDQENATYAENTLSSPDESPHI